MNDEIRMANEELPNWENVRLENVTTKVGSGSTPRGGEASYKTTGIPLIRSMNVVFFGFKRRGLAFIDPSQARALNNATVQAGDVLLNITGASIGRVTVAPTDMSDARVNQHVCIIRPSPALDARFLNAFLSGPTMQHFIFGENYGATRQALTKQQILDFKIPLPSLAEQKRIADKLEAVLGRVDACRARLDRVPALLKRFRQSVLAAATSGKLTEEWRMTNGVNDKWAKSKLGCCGNVSGGLTKNSKRQILPLQKPYLRVANVQANFLSLSDITKIGLTEAEHRKTKLKVDDLLIVEGNGSIDQLGRVAIWGGELNDCVHQNHLIRWRTSGPAPRFILYWLLSPQGRNDLMELASTTTGLHTLSISKVSALPINLPTLPEQQEIVRRVEALFALADRIEARLAVLRKTADRLTPSVLAKAFRGELVPQDPNDEPASVLLERLQSQAAPQPARAPRKKRG